MRLISAFLLGFRFACPKPERSEGVVERHGCNGWYLAHRSPTRDQPYPKAYTDRTGIVHPDLYLKHVSFLRLSHGAQNLVVQHPGSVLFDFQVTLQLQRTAAR
jgi:hypothetical protein